MRGAYLQHQHPFSRQRNFYPCQQGTKRSRMGADAPMAFLFFCFLINLQILTSFSAFRFFSTGPVQHPWCSHRLFILLVQKFSLSFRRYRQPKKKKKTSLSFSWHGNSVASCATNVSVCVCTPSKTVSSVRANGMEHTLRHCFCQTLRRQSDRERDRSEAKKSTCARDSTTGNTHNNKKNYAKLSGACACGTRGSRNCAKRATVRERYHSAEERMHETPF